MREGLMEPAQCRCPTCGSPFVGERPLVDLDTNTFICSSGWVRFQHIQAEIVAILVKAYPGLARYDAIFLGVYGGGEMPDSDPIKVHIHHIRKLIRPLGWEIRAVYGQGYQLLRRGARDA